MFILFSVVILLSNRHELVSRSRQVGLDAVCVTEHHSYFLSDPYKKLLWRRAFLSFKVWNIVLMKVICWFSD